MTQEIKLTQGQVTIVCDCHYHLVKDNKWCAWFDPTSQLFYATRGTTLAEKALGRSSTVHMQVIINNTPKGFMTDHKDHDTLNNQCNNLRTATNVQNARNHRISKNNKSGYHGVSWQARAKKWQSHFTLEGKDIYIGVFANKEDAARAYDAMARLHFGEFAALNFPDSK